MTADAVQLNFENGMSQGLISGTQVRELVLNNRNYEQLLQLQPGVAYGGANDQLYIGVSLPSGTSNQVAFAVNGQRATANNWTIDGADNVDRGANLTLLAFRASMRSPSSRHCVEPIRRSLAGAPAVR